MEESLCDAFGVQLYLIFARASYAFSDLLLILSSHFVLVLILSPSFLVQLGPAHPEKYTFFDV